MRTALMDAQTPDRNPDRAFDQTSSPLAATVLVVDDDAALGQQVAAYLTDNGYLARAVTSGAAMDAALRTDPADLVVLDVMMPGEGGLSICRRLSDAGGPSIIIMSAMGEDIDRVLGLELGADDYLPKPSNPRELLARIKAVLRRREGRSASNTPDARTRISFVGYELDVLKRRLRAPSGVIVMLTTGEFNLLSAFLAHAGRVLSRDQLVEYVRGLDADVFDRAIDVQISRLRRKLGECDAQDLIRTYRGVGYMLNATVIRR